MGTYSNTIPKIHWGYTTFSNTLTFPYKMDNVVSYATSGDNSQFAILQNGDEYGSIVDPTYVLEGDVRWIPDANTTNPPASGWNANEGWRVFLEYARQKLPFNFYPDKTDDLTYVVSYLVEPINGTHGLEIDGTRNVRLIIRNNITPYTGY